MSIDLHHLKRLSAVRSGNNIKFLTPAVYSGGYCPMRVACNITETMEGLSYLMVCMPECATHSRGMNSRPEGEHGEKRWLYTLDANEVIFGCRQGVMDALRTMDKEGAEAILMIATCVTDLIGEDFESIINEIQPELHARLTYVTLGQFKNFGTALGTSKVAQAVGKLMGAPKKKQGKLVNVLFLNAWRAKNSPVKLPLIVNALEKQGITVRRLTSEASLRDFMDGPDAAANMVVSSYMQPMAKEMQDRFDVPCFPLHNAFRVEDIDQAYKMIEQLLDINLADSFTDWRRKAVELEKRAKQELDGRKYVMLTEVDTPVALANFLADFGMEPLLLHVSDLLPEDLLHAKLLKEKGFDPPACRIIIQEHDVRLIRNHLHHDIFFGYMKEPLPGLPTAEEMGDFFGIIGYERTVGILTRIFEVLETGKTEGGFDIYGPAPL